MQLQRSILTASICLFTSFSLLISSACAKTQDQVQSIQKMKVFPLPGQLDHRPMLNSNSPEIISEPGILVSTLPGGEDRHSPFLNYAFQGDFGVFSHHIAKDAYPGQKLLYLGLLVTNQSDQPVKLKMKQGASYLSQPDALFKNWPALTDNSKANIYAGPGDRVTTELLSGQSPLEPTELQIPPRSTRLVYSLPIPTNVSILPPINGRSSLMYFHSDGPVYLSQIASFAHKENGRFVAPSLEDYRNLLNQRQMAGPREPQPTAYDPEDLPKGSGFRYGRVAGVSQGLTWQGSFFEKTRILERPAAGEISAYPLSSVYLKRWGTHQNQSGKMLRRYVNSAVQSHANYGVQYQLNLPLHNDTKTYQTYRLGLSQPTNMSGTANNAEMNYLYPPNRPTMFRGSVRVEWTDEFAIKQDQLKHLVIHHGEQVSPFSMITVPPGVHYDLKLSLYYPPDCTPPQLLTLERLE